MITNATRAVNIPELEPGDLIATDKGPLVVEGVYRARDVSKVQGRRIGADKNAVVKLATKSKIEVVAPPAVLDRIERALVRAVIENADPVDDRIFFVPQADPGLLRVDVDGVDWYVKLRAGAPGPEPAAALTAAAGSAAMTSPEYDPMSGGAQRDGQPDTAAA